MSCVAQSYFRFMLTVLGRKYEKNYGSGQGRNIPRTDEAVDVPVTNRVGGSTGRVAECWITAVSTEPGITSRSRFQSELYSV